MAKIYIIDVTNRDGVQTARLGLAKLEKTLINIYLNEMGIFQSEFGFPVTRHEINYLNANLELQESGLLKPIRLSGWLRATVGDVETTFKNVPKLKHMNISISTSDQMITYKFQGKLDHKSVIKEMVEALRLAKQSGAETVGVNAEDASRTRMEYLTEFALAAKENGADRIRYCDTLGYDSPDTIYERIFKLAEAVKIPIELHCHNDLGMAVGCSVMGAKGAIDAGVDAYVNTTVNGIGERCGNADLVGCILAIKKSSGFANKYILDERVDLSKSWKITKSASYAFGVAIAINQPGIGANAFAHESGIHADGALKDWRNYELYHYEELGRGEPEIIEFKTDEEATKILELARYANVHTQKPLTNDELRFIAKYPEQARKILTVTP